MELEMEPQHVYCRDVNTDELDIKYDAMAKIKKFKILDNFMIEKYRGLINELILGESKLQELKKKYNYTEKNSVLLRIIDELCLENDSQYTKEDREKIRIITQTKKGKSHSGVLVITIFTSPYPKYTNSKGEQVKQEFSCKYDCSYCPNEPGMPRSYLKSEPGVLRATRNEFDCVRQMHDRMDALYNIGHHVDKLEVIVLGGTWESYPIQYRDEFIRDIYYAANIFKGENRVCKVLEEEKKINETTSARIIGLTLETRPDTITRQFIRGLRKYGCTRIQLGVQHISDSILKKINRKCPTVKTIAAIKLLKNAGFKIDIHLMPNLPDSTVEIDREMILSNFLGVKKTTQSWWNWMTNQRIFSYDLTRPDLQADQWKIYPMAVVPYSKVADLYKTGEYKPYSPKDLQKLLIDAQINMFPWIRVNRIIRDITSDYIIASSDYPNMQGDLIKKLKESGNDCKCIRCREVKGGILDDPVIVIRKYNASEADEYFISYESKDLKVLYGFVRLRLCEPDIVTFPELINCALIRELHVYGDLSKVNTPGVHTQHRGIGKMLMEKAEQIAIEHGFKKCSVISGNGVKEYYKKLGYLQDAGEGDFMIKAFQEQIIPGAFPNLIPIPIVYKKKFLKKVSGLTCRLRDIEDVY